MSESDGMHRASKLFVMLALILLASSIVENAACSNTSGYEEEITLEIDFSSGEAMLDFEFGNFGGPLDTSDFADEPSFITISLMAFHAPDYNKALIMVHLNQSRIGSVPEGRLKADALKVRFENLFNITVPYVGTRLSDVDVLYNYEIDECPIQKFRDFFLEYKPSQGFGKIVTPAVIGKHVMIFLMLTRNGDLMEWTTRALVYYPDHFKIGSGQEYTIGLRSLTGYSEAIQASPEASKSTLRINVREMSDRKFELAFLETSPSQMGMRDYRPTISLISFEKVMTASSVDDLSIHFKIASPDYTKPIIFGAVIAAILGIAGFAVRRKLRAHHSLSRVF